MCTYSLKVRIYTWFQLKYLICTFLSTYLDIQMTISTQLLDYSEAHFLLVISHSWVWDPDQSLRVILSLQVIIMLVYSSIENNCAANSASKHLRYNIKDYITAVSAFYPSYHSWTRLLQMLLPHPHPDSLHDTYNMWMKDSSAAAIFFTHNPSAFS